MATTTAPDRTRQQIDRLANSNPEWTVWLALWDTTLDAAADPVWSVAVDDATLAPSLATGAPRLTGATVPVKGRDAAAWVRRLVGVAAKRGAGAGGSGAAFGEAGDRLDPVALIEASINQDAARLDALASTAGIAPDALAALAQFAAAPLLHAFGRAIAPGVANDWDEGFCPVCGAWPAMTERRGLERARRLRCGRCGGDWGNAVVRCPFCAVAGHDRLGSLVPEADREARQVETCAACRGYLKSLTTLRAWAATEVALADLSTVELDLAAIERDYARPETPAVALGLRLTEPEADPAPGRAGVLRRR